jgi:O-antigen/teichoic acid export membrane protein
MGMAPPPSDAVIPCMLIRNTAANLAGQLLYPVLSLVLVPFYLRHLGLEGYGLIGLMALVVSLLAVFSRGLGSALQREIGRRCGTDEEVTLRRLLRSIEVVYWAAGVGFALVLGTVAVTLGPRWVETHDLPPGTVTICLVLLALRVSVAFPHSVYQSVFMGTERQVLGNGLNAALALTSAAGGVVAVLLFGSVVAFYASEAINAVAYLLVLRYFAFSVLPPSPASFDGGEIRGLMGVSVALVWTNGIGLLLSNLDRLIVSAVLPVASLAVYTLAVMGGRLVTLFYNPFLQASFPRMCQVARRGSLEEQTRDVLRNAAVLVVVAAAVGVPLAVFSAEVLALWVGDPAVVRVGAPVMSVYVVASLLIAFASVFYQWQTATGRTGIAVRFNGIALVWFPLLVWTLTSRAGLLGASIAWAVYGALAWVSNLVATFGRDGLPVNVLRAYLRLTVLALAPAVLCTIISRLVADSWFGHSLVARAVCGAVAGTCGGLAAASVVLRRLNPDRRHEAHELHEVLEVQAPRTSRTPDPLNTLNLP